MACCRRVATVDGCDINCRRRAAKSILYESDALLDGDGDDEDVPASDVSMVTSRLVSPFLFNLMTASRARIPLSVAVSMICAIIEQTEYPLNQ